MGVWNGLKDGIRSGNIDSAVARIAATKQDAYRQMLTALGSQGTAVDQILPSVAFVELSGNRAEYHMPRMDNGLLISHFILFVREDDGVWRVKFF
jgi:hypothetical protein